MSTIINTIKDLPKSKAIIFDHALVVVSLLNDEVQFTTYEGTDINTIYDNPFEGFIYTGQPFSMREMMEIKDLLISMLLEHFGFNPGSFLKYTPTCSKRGRIYLAFLARAGFTCIDYDYRDFMIIYPH